MNFMITFSDKVTLDSNHISGHYAVHDNITIGLCRVGSTLRGGNYLANALSANTES